MILFDLGAAGVRFGWWEVMDFPAGVTELRLKIWRQGLAADVFRFTMGLGASFSDMRDYLDTSQELKADGMLPSDDELLLEADFAGRKLSVPVSEWTAGLALEADREWLKASITPGLREALEAIRTVAERERELYLACLYVIHPLLGLPPEGCDVNARSFVDFAGKLDCDFDDRFGEPCSLRQRLDFEARQGAQGKR